MSQHLLRSFQLIRSTIVVSEHGFRCFAVTTRKNWDHLLHASKSETTAYHVACPGDRKRPNYQVNE